MPLVHSVLGPVNTYAITATAAVNRQCNEEGAAKGGSLGATTEAATTTGGFLTYNAVTAYVLTGPRNMRCNAAILPPVGGFVTSASV